MNQDINGYYQEHRLKNQMQSIYFTIQFLSNYNKSIIDNCHVNMKIFLNNDLVNYLCNDCFYRNTYNNINNEIILPKIEEKIFWLKFSSTERMIYNAYLSNPKIDKKILKQLCYHPKLVDQIKHMLVNCHTLNSIENTILSVYIKNIILSYLKLIIFEKKQDKLFNNIINLSDLLNKISPIGSKETICYKHIFEIIDKNEFILFFNKYYNEILNSFNEKINNNFPCIFINNDDLSYLPNHPIDSLGMTKEKNIVLSYSNSPNKTCMIQGGNIVSSCKGSIINLCNNNIYNFSKSYDNSSTYTINTLDGAFGSVGDKSLSAFGGEGNTLNPEKKISHDNIYNFSKSYDDKNISKLNLTKEKIVRVPLELPQVYKYDCIHTPLVISERETAFPFWARKHSVNLFVRAREGLCSYDGIFPLCHGSHINGAPIITNLPIVPPENGLCPVEQHENEIYNEIYQNIDNEINSKHNEENKFSSYPDPLIGINNFTEFLGPIPLQSHRFQETYTETPLFMRDPTQSPLISHNILKEIKIDLNKFVIKDLQIKDCISEYNGTISTYTFYKNVFTDLKTKEYNTCNICLEKIIDDDNISVTSCGHIFCYNCIKKAIYNNKQCPICRTYVDNNNIYLISYELENNTQKNKMINSVGTKIANLILFLYENNDQYTIIFSQWDSTLKKIHTDLKQYNINNIICKGNTYQKNKIIHNFNTTDNIKIIMFSLENMIYGLNLTKASQIIFLDPINGSVEYRNNIENKAKSRAYRYRAKQYYKGI